MIEGYWGELGKAFAGLFGAGGGIYFARWLITWLTGRHDKRQELLDAQDREIDARWKSYTRKIEERCAELERSNEECHQARLLLEKRVARLEGYDHGMGDRRQEAQIARSAEAVAAADRSNIGPENDDVGKN